MTIKNLFFILTIILGQILVACQAEIDFECNDEIGCVEIGPGEPIQIGVLQSLDVEKTHGGVEQTNAITLAIKNRAGQVASHPIELQIENSGCLPEGGTTTALKISANPDIVGVLGTTCSGAAATAAEILSDAGLVMISGSNTAPSLTQVSGAAGKNWYPGYYRTILNGTLIAQTAAIFTYQEFGTVKAATINDGDLYTQELAQEFENTFIELGGEIVFSGEINKNDTDMKPILTALANTGAQLVYLPIFQSEATLILKQANLMDFFTTMTWLGGETLTTQQFIETLGTDGIGMFFTSPATPSGENYDSLISDYKKQFKIASAHHTVPYAYDAANLLFHAIESVAVNRADGTLSIGRAALREELYATIDFEGVTGTLKCNKFGDCSAVNLLVVFLENPGDGLEGLLSNIVFKYEQSNPEE